MKRSARIELKIKNGVVAVASDAHYWPGKRTTAHRAFVQMIPDADVVIMNGDVIDGASISRHPRIGWEYQPTMQQELAVADERLYDIEKASPNVRHIWNLGNHDARFELRLAQVAPEYEGVHGIHLKDHFPRWEPAWSVGINNNTIIKHRFKGGIHAAFNNAKDSGRSIITGHLHALNISAFTDYNGTRWGVDGGTLADPLGPQFSNYTEDNPLNWRSGFVFLRYVGGVLRQPELCFVVDEGRGVVTMNGKDYRV